MKKTNDRNAGRKTKYSVESKRINEILPVVVIEKIKDLAKPYLTVKSKAQDQP